MPTSRISLALFLTAACCIAPAHAAEPAGTSGTVAVTMPAAQAAQPFRISVCDWMILKRQKLSAFQLTKEIGADGLEVDMGGLGNRETFDSKFGDPLVREQFLAKSRELGVRISSIAMSGFYAQSFAERPGYERITQDAIDAAVALGLKNIFLPLGEKCDLVAHPELRPVIIQRLKTVGANAAKAGVVIGIETSLDAKAEVALLEEIGSPAIRSYFNFQNALRNKRDLIAELRTLGRDRICQIHCTNEDKVWLQNDTAIDMPKVKAALEAMGWSGWLVIERSRDASDPRNVKRNFSANAAFLKSVFQSQTP